MEIKYDDFLIVSFTDESKKDEILSLIEKVEKFACVDSYKITIQQEDKNKLLFSELINLGVVELYAKIFNKNDYLIQNAKVIKEIYKY